MSLVIMRKRGREGEREDETACTRQNGALGGPLMILKSGVDNELLEANRVSTRDALRLFGVLITLVPVHERIAKEGGSSIIMALRVNQKQSRDKGSVQ